MYCKCLCPSKVKVYSVYNSEAYIRELHNNVMLRNLINMPSSFTSVSEFIIFDLERPKFDSTVNQKENDMKCMTLHSDD